MLKFMYGYIRGKIRILFFFTIVTLLTTGLSIFIPYLNGIFIDSISYEPNKETIIRYTIIVAILLTSSLVINYLYTVLNAKIKLDLSYNVYKDIVYHVQRIPYIIYKKYNPTYLNQRINTDIAKVWNFFLEYYVNIIVHSLSFILLMYLIYKLNIYIFVATLILIPIYIGIYIWSKKPIYIFGLESKERGAEYYKIGNEQLELANEIKANSLFEASFVRLNKEYKRYYEAIMKYTRVTQFFKSMDLSVSMLLQVFIILIGGFEIINGNLTLGKFVIINSYYNTLFQIIKFFFLIGQEYIDTKNSLNRLQEIMSIREEKFGDKFIKDVESIKLKNISFKYEDELVINSFTQNFSKGNIYILRGSNGAGKSTLLYLIIGILKNESLDEICYDGISINNLDINNMRGKVISIYLQNAKSFDLSVSDTIELYTGLTQAEVVKKINCSNLRKIYFSSDFDISLYFDKKINELSGGEHQKVQLLCHVLVDYSVLILDEPTSNLDKQSTFFLQQYLESEVKEKIIIIVTHDSEFIEAFREAQIITLA